MKLDRRRLFPVNMRVEMGLLIYYLLILQLLLAEIIRLMAERAPVETVHQKLPIYLNAWLHV